MCGRFENKRESFDTHKNLQEQIELDFEISESDNEKINIAPTLPISTVMKKEGKICLTSTTWGIKFTDRPLIFNSRVETIKEKPYWKNLLELNRSLVPMTAFYEWKKLTNGKKQPYRIFLADHELFYVPSLSIRQMGLEGYFTSIITTGPNKFMEGIHHRMPVIFTRDKVSHFFEMPLEILLEECCPLNDNVKMQLEIAYL